jgi:uridine phosphorylase
MNNYPNFANKHDGDSIFSPNDFLTYLKTTEIEIPVLPETIVFVYQGSLARHIAERSDFSKSETLSNILNNGNFLVSNDGKIGVISRFGIGSPIAAAILEEMIVMGAKRFFNIGTAGSLQKDVHVGDIILCDRAIRDEGTSHHYVKPEKFSYPSPELTDLLENTFIENGTSYRKGSSWTIDAIYRETVEEARKYQSEGIITVEMEASAMFAVTKYRGKEIAAAFVISDLLGELEWKPAFKDDKTEKGLERLFESIVLLTNTL